MMMKLMWTKGGQRRRKMNILIVSIAVSQWWWFRHGASRNGVNVNDLMTTMTMRVCDMSSMYIVMDVFFCLIAFIFYLYIFTLLLLHDDIPPLDTEPAVTRTMPRAHPPRGTHVAKTVTKQPSASKKEEKKEEGEFTKGKMHCLRRWEQSGWLSNTMMRIQSRSLLPLLMSMRPMPVWYVVLLLLLLLLLSLFCIYCSRSSCYCFRYCRCCCFE